MLMLDDDNELLWRRIDGVRLGCPLPITQSLGLRSRKSRLGFAYRLGGTYASLCLVWQARLIAIVHRREDQCFRHWRSEEYLLLLLLLLLLLFVVVVV
jgi:hypothetical protein